MSTPPPEICISFAPPEETVVEPCSPSFTCASPIDDSAFRSVHLTPPQTLTKFSKGVKPLSPLRPSDNDTAPVQGLERERFEALIQAAKERRNLVMGSKKARDLRRETTLKAHKNKQVQRRALFFAKVLSQFPNATLTPTTLPESPAIHDSLPSPERVSPLALFKSLSEDDKYCPMTYGHEPWVEPVDFQSSQYAKLKEISLLVRLPPSLDQISAHMTCRTARSSVNAMTDLTLCPVVVSHQPRLQVGVGRLQMPIRDTTQSHEILSSELQKSRGTLELPVKATMAPAPQSNSLTPSSRERRAHNMLSTLRRRTSVYERRLDVTEPEANWKRHSAPGDLLPLRSRSGFKHPVLTLPGSF